MSGGSGGKCSDARNAGDPSRLLNLVFTSASFSLTVNDTPMDTDIHKDTQTHSQYFDKNFSNTNNTPESLGSGLCFGFNDLLPLLQFLHLLNFFLHLLRCSKNKQPNALKFRAHNTTLTNTHTAQTTSLHLALLLDVVRELEIDAVRRQHGAACDL